MAALLRRRPRVHTLPVTLGRTSLPELTESVHQLLTDPRVRVVLDVVAFTYFDERALTALTGLADGHERVTLRGLDQYGETLLSAPHDVLDVRTRAERALTHLDAVTVINAVAAGRPLDDATWDDALARARAARRSLVTVDLRRFPELSAHQTLSLAEFSADLGRELRTLIIVNANPQVADQLRLAGLHGGLLMGTDDRS